MKYKDQKITFVVPQLCTGGVEINFLNLANNLIEEFSQIEILYQQEIDSGNYRSQFNEKINFFKLKKFGGIKLISELHEYYDEVKPSIVVVSMYVVAAYMLVARIFSKHKPKIIINGGNHFTSFIQKSKKFKEKYFFLYFAKIIFQHADFFVSQCNDMTDDILYSLNLPNEKIKTIYNPVVSEDFDYRKLPHPSHPWFSTNRSYKILIMAGRLVEQKRVIEFLDIFKELTAQLNLKLIILGEGPLEDAVINKINSLKLDNSVNLLPNQKNFLSFIANSDLMVVNSEYEGLNNMIIHALSCGTSIVSTNCPVGPSEILQNGKFGRLVDISDKNNMKHSIICELQQPLEEAENLVKRSLEFTINKSSRKYIQLFNILLNQDKKKV